VTVTLRDDQQLVIVAEHWASRLRVWSDPVQLYVEPTGDPDLLDLVFRRCELENPERFFDDDAQPRMDI